jgi:peptidyl-tRNA hydrolase, PTH1 family
MNVQPRLIVGLGNPGAEYRDTRHNVGYLVVDRLRAVCRTELEEQARWRGLHSAVRYRGGRLNLLKPTTFMNDSGYAVSSAARALDLSPAEILILCDCLDLPLGRIRLRRGGSSGGHRGVASIIEHLGGSDFPRLRVGIGRPPGHAVEHVLATWSEQEASVLDEVVKTACEAILCVVSAGLDTAMNKYNAWQTGPDSTEADHPSGACGSSTPGSSVR